MEKKTPHYELSGFQREFSSPRALRMTRTASSQALALGMSMTDVVVMVQDMKRSHFFKAMTSHADATIWQDVYHVPWAGLLLYVKLTVDGAGRLLLQLKEK
jgi:motility quorum-sensing regulator / GCU-specific mRNA interferase toxin